MCSLFLILILFFTKNIEASLKQFINQRQLYNHDPFFVTVALITEKEVDMYKKTKLH